MNYFQKDFITGFQNRFPTFGFMLVAREIAMNFHLLNATSELRIIGDNSLAPMLAYYGVAKSVGSLYWPNGEGIKDNAKFLSASSDSDALEVIKKRGITHVLLQSADSKRAEIALWTHKGTRDIKALKNTFAYRMAYNPASHPAWLKPYKPILNRFSKQDRTVYYKIDLAQNTK